MTDSRRTVFATAIVVLMLVFLLVGCSFSAVEDASRNLPVLPTKLPELIKDAVDEAQDAKEEIAPELPLEPADISQDAFMYYQQAEDVLAPYAGFIEGLLFSRAVDLEVVNIVDASDKAELGFQFEAEITIRNNGYATSPQSKLGCEIHGREGLGGWNWIPSLAPGQSVNIRMGFSAASLPLGDHDYSCTADSDNTLIELNKRNNTRTISITLTMTNTDLRIVNVKNITREPVIGYDAEFKVTVENKGPERSYKVALRCTYQKGIGSVEEQIVWIGPMATAGETIDVICGFNDVPSGTHTLTVEVDHGNMIRESNEDNNNSKVTFRR
jgi:subtilase family serine protease